MGQSNQLSAQVTEVFWSEVILWPLQWHQLIVIALLGHHGERKSSMYCEFTEHWTTARFFACLGPLETFPLSFSQIAACFCICRCCDLFFLQLLQIDGTVFLIPTCYFSTCMRFLHWKCVDHRCRAGLSQKQITRCTCNLMGFPYIFISVESLTCLRMHVFEMCCVNLKLTPPLWWRRRRNWRKCRG